MTTTSRSLRAQLAAASDGPLVVPGVGTPLEAHAAAAAGFGSVYLSGYAVAAWRHGVPDVGLIALAEISAALEAVTSAVGAAVICDADTGYGDVASAARTVRHLEARGASAIQLEDQAWPKRCGHLRGKSVIPAAEHARKIAAAVKARASAETLIIARTDALAPNGLPDALDRARRYADAGADILFIDAPPSMADIERIGKELAGRPLVANMSESGLTPQLSAAQWHELGFSIVIYPTSSLRIAAKMTTAFYLELMARGDSRAWIDRMHSLDELNTLVGLPLLEEFESSLAGEAS